MTNPYSPPTTSTKSATEPGRTPKSIEPGWPLYVFATLAIGVLATGGVWVWFALERIYNTAKPAAEMAAFSACFTMAVTSLVLAVVLHRKSMLSSGSGIRRVVQFALVLIATLPCILAAWSLVEITLEVIL
ncbi:hypothetical protein [Rhodopirellula europaea]|uniref:Membrane protein n=1 Tax=Rhodopirellula europaea 6C TaxID=1263867 RepID=M2B448_9BACT|nr:hypothetical protein [Rhodopirellula europaea]EMB16503.1 membrane protein [Rhodopirellula europaea 6C]